MAAPVRQVITFVSNVALILDNQEIEAPQSRYATFTEYALKFLAETETA